MTLYRRPSELALVALVVLATAACGPSGGTPTDDRPAGEQRSGRPASPTLHATDDASTGPTSRALGGGTIGVGCEEMLGFVGTGTPLPGEPTCTRSDGIDTAYGAVLTASRDEIAAWLATVAPDAVLGDACPPDEQACVQVPHAPHHPGDWHYLDVVVRGTGADAAVTVTAMTV
ncbi:hypothetical protein [Cellulomonas sp. S1-8]|uniref:hypothetical protein n=1 Tax=Cellulomonas sp. S1-8 TaxID=2904790 RepID=UPI00224396EF|nr:hypothetical protein [Cellulomonas sp. S1-8]UZN04747.1 hypothetical protein OKX07_07535 [Cellulomonas sp. S1-8]